MPEPQEIYKQKKVSMGTLIEKIKSGQTICTGIFFAYPTGVMNALSEYGDHLDELLIWNTMGMSPSPVLFNPGTSIICGFLGPIERMVQKKANNVFFYPLHYCDILTKRDEIARPDWYVLALTPMDEDGYLNFHFMGAVEHPFLLGDCANPHVKTVVEVNKYLPRVNGLEEFGSHRVHVSQVDYIVEHHQPLMQPPVEAPTEVDKQIAAHVAELIDDGDTIQIGIGSLPDAIAVELTKKKELGIHTEMIGDGLVKLIKSGAVTNTHKTLYPHKTVSAFAFGSSELTEWIDNNPDVIMLPIHEVNSASVIAKNRNMRSVNSILTIDFRGQAAAHTAGGKNYSGVGGSFEFAYGSQLASGGRSILCMRSTAQLASGRVSNIVPFLPPGSAVTIPEHIVDWVVTEYGSARLKVMNMDQRIRALISLAHPDYRDELTEAALKMGIREFPGIDIAGNQ